MLKRHAALFLVISLSLIGCITLIGAQSEDALAGYGFILIAVVFIPIWNAQRKGSGD